MHECRKVEEGAQGRKVVEQRRKLLSATESVAGVGLPGIDSRATCPAVAAVRHVC